MSTTKTTTTTDTKGTTMSTSTTTTTTFTLEQASAGMSSLTGEITARMAGAHSAIVAAEAMGYPRAKPITDALKAFSTAYARLESLPEPRPFTGDDLMADDWQERLTARTIERETLEARRAMSIDGLREVQRNVFRACVDELDTLGDWLEAWLIEHAEDFAAAEGRTDSSESVARIEAREASLAQFNRAMHSLLRANSKGADSVTDYRARWWLLHSFTPAQWQELEDSTGPQLSTPRPFTLAQHIGATLRLARSYEQPWQDFVAMQQPVEDERIERMFAEQRVSIIGARV